MSSTQEVKKTKPFGAGTPNGQEKNNVVQAYFEVGQKASALHCLPQRGRSLSPEMEAA